VFTEIITEQITQAEQAAQQAAIIQQIKTAEAEKRAVVIAIEKMLIADELTDDEIAEILDVFAPWAYPVAYATNAVVRYDSVAYKCIQAHTSQSDWMPDAVPALWSAYTPAGVIAAWVQPYGGSGTYVEGAVVTHNGQTWLNTNPGPQLNVWEPGVYGWTQQ